MHVEHLGDHGPAILLVHGSIVPGWQTWQQQRALSGRYRLVVPHRSGYPPNPPLDHIDFETQATEIAELIEPGMHVVGHSYGGVVSLLAARIAPERVRSLTVIEPPAFGVARGNPAVEALIERLTPVYADLELSPREFFLQFTGAVGARPQLPEVLPPEVVASIQATRVERFPWEARVPLVELRAHAFPKLVFSGGHSPAFDAVVEVLVAELGAERTVITGSGHSVQRTGQPFNTRLEWFIDAAETPGQRTAEGTVARIGLEGSRPADRAAQAAEKANAAAQRAVAAAEQAAEAAAQAIDKRSDPA